MPEKIKPGRVILYLVIGFFVWLIYTTYCGKEKGESGAERVAMEAVDTVIARYRQEDPNNQPRSDLKYWRWCENPKGNGVVVEIGGNCWLVVGKSVWAVTGGLAKLPSIEFSGIPGTPKSGLWWDDVKGLLKPFK